MYCNKCGAQFPDGAKLCPGCGAALSVADGKKKKKGMIFAAVGAVVIFAVCAGLLVPKLLQMRQKEPDTREAAGAVEEISSVTASSPDPVTSAPAAIASSVASTSAATETKIETTAGTTAAVSQTEDADAKYLPGHYVHHTFGGITLYRTAGSDGDDFTYVETPPGELARIEVTEVRINPRSEYDYDVWRGKTAVDGITGWVDLYEWTPTDLHGTTLRESEVNFVLEKLRGAWRYTIGDQLIEFAEGENGRLWVTATGKDNASGTDFSCEIIGPGAVYGDPGRLVRITLTTAQGYERELFVDLTLIAKNQIMWQFGDGEWTCAYYDGTSIEDAGPYGGGAR